jgi:hypothetical protein
MTPCGHPLLSNAGGQEKVGEHDDAKDGGGRRAIRAALKRAPDRRTDASLSAFQMLPDGS